MLRTKLEEAWKNLPRRLISEATLVRVLKHVSKGQGFAIVTAYNTTLNCSEGEEGVDWRTNAENRKANLELSRYLTRELKKSVIGVGGGWTPTDKETGKPVGEPAVPEPSFFVLDISRQEAKALISYVGQVSGQWSIIWGSKENGIWEFNRDGGETFQGNAFNSEGRLSHPEVVLKAWSNARRRHLSERLQKQLDEQNLEFYFAYVPQGSIDAMGWYETLGTLAR